MAKKFKFVFIEAKKGALTGGFRKFNTLKEATVARKKAMRNKEYSVSKISKISKI